MREKEGHGQVKRGLNVKTSGASGREQQSNHR